MPKFKVIASYKTYCVAEVEADDVHQAREIAWEMDGGDFVQEADYADDNWSIEDVTELTEEEPIQPQGRIIQADGWTLMTKEGEPVRENQVVTHFRGGLYKVTGGNPPHKPSSTGRVYVAGAEFFPTVFNLKWVKASTHSD